MTGDGFPVHDTVSASEFVAMCSHVGQAAAAELGKDYPDEFVFRSGPVTLHRWRSRDMLLVVEVPYRGRAHGAVLQDLVDEVVVAHGLTVGGLARERIWRAVTR